MNRRSPLSQSRAASLTKLPPPAVPAISTSVFPSPARVSRTNESPIEPYGTTRASAGAARYRRRPAEQPGASERQRESGQLRHAADLALHRQAPRCGKADGDPHGGGRLVQVTAEDAAGRRRHHPAREALGGDGQRHPDEQGERGECRPARPCSGDRPVKPRAIFCHIRTHLINHGEAPRASRRPSRQARGGRIPAVFDPSGTTPSAAPDGCIAAECRRGL